MSFWGCRGYKVYCNVHDTRGVVWIVFPLDVLSRKSTFFWIRFRINAACLGATSSRKRNSISPNVVEITTLPVSNDGQLLSRTEHRDLATSSLDLNSQMKVESQTRSQLWKIYMTAHAAPKFRAEHSTQNFSPVDIAVVVLGTKSSRWLWIGNFLARVNER